MTNDTELLRHYAEEHSENAFASLVQRHLNLVYFAALRRTNGDAPLAEDVTQHVFASLAKHASTLQRHASLTGWLYVTTRHAAANAMRAEKRRINREQEAHAMEETASTPHQETDWSQLRPQLDHAIDELNERDRMAVLLRFFENRPFAEIGTALRVSEDAARVRVDRALDKLRALLVRRGITSTAAALTVALSSQSALAAPAGLAASVTGYVAAGSVAAGVSSATTALSLWQLMSTSKIILGATAALAFSAAIYESVELRKAKIALAATARETATLNTRLQQENARVAEIEKNLHAAEKLVSSLQKNANETAKKTTSAAKPAVVTRSAGPTGDPQLNLMLTNPEYQELQLKVFRSSLRFTYGPLYRKLGLTPQQITDFEALMVEKQQIINDLFAAAHTQGVSLANTPLTDPALNGVQEKLRALLGDPGLEQYTLYDKTSFARRSADSLATALYDTPTPLTAEQADRLTLLIDENRKKPEPNASGTSSRQFDWDQVPLQAKAILTPPQLDVLKALAGQKRFQQQMSALEHKLTSNAITGASNAAELRN